MTTSSAVGPGTVLGGRYRLDDLLSDYAGARLWRATDTVLARHVAVHAVASDDARSPRLIDGARSAVSVSDPRLLRVLDCDDDDTTTWVVAEWGDGLSLDLMLERGPLPAPRAAWLAHEVATAVVTAHAAGVAHGRLAPELVMVTRSGAVKIIGFVLDAVLHGTVPSPTYGDLDPLETDVVDVAGILYAALTGRWAGASPSNVPLAPVENGRVLRARQVRAGVPRHLDALCQRVLTPEGTRRGAPIRDAEELAEELAQMADDQTDAPPLDLSGVHAESTAVLPRHPGGAVGAAAPADPVRHDETPRGTHEDVSERLEADEVTRRVDPTGPRPLAEADQADQADQADEADEVTQRVDLTRATTPGAPDEGTRFIDLGGEGTTTMAAPVETPASAPVTAPVTARTPLADHDAADPEAANGDPNAEADPDSTQLSRSVPGDDVAESPAGFGALRGEAAAPGREPIPPFEDIPERPLFSPTPRRVPSGSAHEPSVSAAALGGWDRAVEATGSPAAQTGAGATVPPDDDPWPFTEGRGATAARFRGNEGRSWLRLAAVIAVGLALLVAVGFVVSRGTQRLTGGGSETPSQSTGSGSGQAAGVPLSVTAVKDFDPQGDPATENPETVGNTVDGDPATTWRTLTYRGRPDLGGLKTGIGVLVDLGARRQVGSVQVRFVGSPTSVELLSAGGSRPTTADGLPVLVRNEKAGTTAVLRPPKPARTRYLVVWMTRLPPVDGGFRGEIAEILVRS